MNFIKLILGFVFLLGWFPYKPVNFFVAGAANGILPSCRAGKYFLLDQKVFKKSRQNEASARMATSPSPFCRACALVAVIKYYVLVSCFWVSIGMELLTFFLMDVVIYTKQHLWQ